MEDQELTVHRYKLRERNTVITDILQKMETWGITSKDLDEYREKHEININLQLQKIRRKIAQREVKDGRRKVPTK